MALGRTARFIPFTVMIASLMGLPLLSVISPRISAKAPCFCSLLLVARVARVSFATVLILLTDALPLNLLSLFALLANEATGMVIAAAIIATGMIEGVIKLGSIKLDCSGKKRSSACAVPRGLFWIASFGQIPTLFSPMNKSARRISDCEITDFTRPRGKELHIIL